MNMMNESTLWDNLHVCAWQVSYPRRERRKASRMVLLPPDICKVTAKTVVEGVILEIFEHVVQPRFNWKTPGLGLNLRCRSQVTIQGPMLGSPGSRCMPPSLSCAMLRHMSLLCFLLRCDGLRKLIPSHLVCGVDS